MLLSYHMDSSEALLMHLSYFNFPILLLQTVQRNCLLVNEISPTHYFPLFPSTSLFSLLSFRVRRLCHHNESRSLTHLPPLLTSFCCSQNRTFPTKNSLSLFLQDLFWCSSMNVAQVLRAEYYDQNVRIY